MSKNNKPSREEAMEAVKILIRWAGDNPEREGLLETPKRVVDAYNEMFCGYDEDPAKILGKTFEETDGYDEMVVLKDILFESHCEHHMIPIVGRAHIAYIPNGRVVGISKIARAVDIFAKRLQIQETMTSQIAGVIDEVLAPKGVAVVIEAEHQCMTTRGVYKPGVTTQTSKLTGIFRQNPATRQEFFAMIGAELYRRP